MGVPSNEECAFDPRARVPFSARRGHHRSVECPRRHVGPDSGVGYSRQQGSSVPNDSRGRGVTAPDGRALVIGKFLPPHAGHHALIEFAAEHASHVDVIVCDLEGQRPTAAARCGWIEEIHPEARVRVVPDICGWHAPDPCTESCSKVWADHLRDRGLGPWQTVVSSESYGPRFANELGSRHVVFDPARELHPSGSGIRADLGGQWEHLHPVVRIGLTRKVVIVGAESTGTTTLAGDLAQRLDAPLVDEYVRYLAEKLARDAGSIWDVQWTEAHFDAIADGQERWEVERLATWGTGQAAPFHQLGPWLVCDTDLLAVAIWHERYLGTPADSFVERALDGPRVPALYVLTSPIGVAFEQDGLRDGEHLREWMTRRLQEALPPTGIPWIEVHGDRDVRLDAVLDALQTLPGIFHQPIDDGVSPERAPIR